MARARAKLSDKLERIMVQSQLMGLTTADMVKIANRMRVLDAEREFKREVDEACNGMSWAKIDRMHYTITDRKGRHYDCVCKEVSRSGWGWERSEHWDVTITHPGTRMKPKTLTKETLYELSGEIVSACPDKDKRLWRLVRKIHNGHWG
jgi:hypothetical protein